MESAASPSIPAGVERLSAEDLETASIHSAAPSYRSEAPSYHSTAPHIHEPVPPYSPPAPSSASGPVSAPSAGSGTNAQPRLNSDAPTRPSPNPTTAQSQPRTQPRQGLPPVPSGPVRRSPTGLPSLGEFRIPSWSTLNANPTARHYQRVAQRRVMAASTSATDAKLGCLRRIMQDRANAAETPGGRARPLEDPYLVGEAAAARARSERLARENPEEMLVHDDWRWDWFLAQTRDWQDRERGWNHFQRGMGTGPRGKLARRIGAR